MRCPELKSYINECPDKHKAELFRGEAMKFERRKHLRDAQVNVIAKSIRAKTSEINIIKTT